MKRGLKFSEAAAPDLPKGDKKKLPGPTRNPSIEVPNATVKSLPKSLNEIAPENKLAKRSTRGIKKNRKESSKLRPARLSKSKESSVKSATVKLGKTQGASYLEKPPVVLRKKVAKQKPRSGDSKKRFPSESGPVEKLVTVPMKNRKSAVMSRRPKNEFNAIVDQKEQISNTLAQEQEVNANIKAAMTRPARSKKRSAAKRGRSTERNGKVYIILDGKSANVVDEQGLMMHIFTNPSSGARYFEASEVEARVQITKK
jgi:hypothetical protein